MLCTVLGVAELAGDPRFASNTARVENRVAPRNALEERLATPTARTWARELSEAGVPAGVVNDIGAAFELARELGLRPTVAIERDEGRQSNSRATRSACPPRRRITEGRPALPPADVIPSGKSKRLDSSVGPGLIVARYRSGREDARQREGGVKCQAQFVVVRCCQG
jgi:hypothetical protein